MTEDWNNDTSLGRAMSITLWRSRRHRWEFALMWDRVHRNGNYLFRFEFIRLTRAIGATKP